MNKPRSVRLLREFEDLRFVVVQTGPDGALTKIDVAKEIRLTGRETSDILPFAAEQYLFWANLLARARNERRRLERKLDETKALVDQSIRINDRNVIANDGDDVIATSEWAVKTATETSPRVHKARKRLEKAWEYEEAIAAVVAAMEYRKSMLMLRAGQERRRSEA